MNRELDKMLAVKDKSQVIGEFLDWLLNHKGYVLARYSCYEHREKTMSKQEEALKCSYELYRSVPGHKAAARKLNAAVNRAAKSALKRVSKGEQQLQPAMCAALTEHVQPVMKQLSLFGANDTEPEWRVVDVLTELIESRLGIKIHVDGWDLRASM